MILPENDAHCGWLNNLPERASNPEFSEDSHCEWVVIGAGYTGLSAARKLAELHPNERIVILEANDAGCGASARNSGYLVDSTLNDGHLNHAGLNAYREKYALFHRALKRVEHFVVDNNIDCDWNPCGKFHATAVAANESRLHKYADMLARCGISHKLLEHRPLSKRLGTEFYHMAIHTEGGVLLDPAKLARAMIDCLPAGVELYENSPVTKFRKRGGGYEITTPKGKLTTDKIIACSNGFLPQLGIAKSRVLPLTLTASMTRPLTDKEFESLGRPKEWGVLSVAPMGATVRMTADRRIMIRNTAEAYSPINMSDAECNLRQSTHRASLLRRFPGLSEVEFTSCWSGVTCISRNSANLFQRLAPNLFAAGCYNGGGIGLATLFGEEIALYASGGDSEAIQQINKRPKPSLLPPQPFLNWGVRSRLARDRRKAEQER